MVRPLGSLNIQVDHLLKLFLLVLHAEPECSKKVRHKVEYLANGERN